MSGDAAPAPLASACGGTGVPESGGRPPEATPERARGYLEVAVASLINGSIGVMVTFAQMPTTMLLCVRMAFAAVALGAVVAVTGSWRDLRKPGVRLRVLAISASLAGGITMYFYAIRYTGVAVAIFLSYLAPLYLAVVAPRVLREATDRVVYIALVVGLAGMALILVPGLLLEGAKLSLPGLLCGWGAGAAYTVYLLLGKSLRARHVRSTPVVFAESTITALAMLVPGVLAVSATGYVFTGTDLLLAALLGLVATAFSFTVFMDGLRYVRVQHASIIAYLEPVSAPLYALVFLGQAPSAWTVAGGALIVAAGLVVVLYGRDEPEPELVG